LVRRFLSIFAALLALGLAFGASLLVGNSRFTATFTGSLLAWSKSIPAPSDNDLSTAELLLRARVAFYEREVRDRFLLDGMVVNLDAAGRPLDVCDSLLFSSLRFVSLKKLGDIDSADAAWTAIRRSGEDGIWMRHPRCAKFLSRDMIVGLLVALTQAPDGSQGKLKDLLRVVEERGGFFSHGPASVSFLSPGLSQALGRVAVANGVHPSRLPTWVQSGVSTIEYNVMFLSPGYATHLVALNTWIELELGARFGRGADFDSSLAVVDPIAGWLTSSSFSEQRLAWVSQRLVDLDSKNLFFRYLRLRTAGALSPAVRLALKRELLSAQQFPETRMPMNCDRRADYLWQRASREYSPVSDSCSKQFNAVDFLWMAALLLESGPDGSETERLPQVAH